MTSPIIVEPLKPAVARIVTTGTRIVQGGGVLIDGMHVVTCAHVVANALGLQLEEKTRPTQWVSLDFPLASGVTETTAEVVVWEPYQHDGSGDIAILKLKECPEKCTAAPLVWAQHTWGRPFAACGFPTSHDGGTWSSGELLETIEHGLLQIEAKKTTGHRVQRGYSGCPVWDLTGEGVIGIIAAAEVTASEKVAYVIPLQRLKQVWPELPWEPRHGKPPGAGPKYACYLSFRSTVHNTLAERVVNEIRSALQNELKMYELDVYWDDGRHHDDVASEDGLALSLCQSACLVMIFWPAYLDTQALYCALEYKAMEELEAKRLSSIRASLSQPKLGLIVPIIIRDSPGLPEEFRSGKRAYFDFSSFTLADPDITIHPVFAPKIRDIAAHIVQCHAALSAVAAQKLLDGPGSPDCDSFAFPDEDMVHSWLSQQQAQIRRKLLPGRKPKP